MGREAVELPRGDPGSSRQSDEVAAKFGGSDVEREERVVDVATTLCQKRGHAADGAVGSFGDILVVWDRLLGTYLPAVPCENVGLEGYRLNRGVLQDLAETFHRSVSAFIPRRPTADGNSKRNR